MQRPSGVHRAREEQPAAAEDHSKRPASATMAVAQYTLSSVSKLNLGSSAHQVMCEAGYHWIQVLTRAGYFSASGRAIAEYINTSDRTNT